MRKLLLLAIIAFATASFSEYKLRGEFNSFVKKYNKKYSSLKEYTKRLHIFITNMERLKKRNKSFEGVTKFMDMTENEFRAQYLSHKMERKKNVKNPIKFKRTKKDYPESYNWVELGAVNMPRDQGACDSSYAMAGKHNYIILPV